MRFFDSFLPNLILLVVGIVILTVIHFTVQWNYTVGAIALGIGIMFWLSLTQNSHHDSDPAGNGMADGFEMLLNIAKAIVLTITFWLFMRFSSNTDQVMMVSKIVLIVYFIKRYVFCVFEL